MIERIRAIGDWYTIKRRFKHRTAPIDEQYTAMMRENVTRDNRCSGVYSCFFFIDIHITYKIILFVVNIVIVVCLYTFYLLYFSNIKKTFTEMIYRTSLLK